MLYPQKYQIKKMNVLIKLKVKKKKTEQEKNPNQFRIKQLK